MSGTFTALSPRVQGYRKLFVLMHFSASGVHRRWLRLLLHSVSKLGLSRASLQDTQASCHSVCHTRVSKRWSYSQLQTLMRLHSLTPS